MGKYEYMTQETFDQYVYRMAANLTKETNLFMKYVKKAIHMELNNLSHENKNEYIIMAATLIPKRVVYNYGASTPRKKNKSEKSSEYQLNIKKKLVKEYITLIRNRGTLLNGKTPTPPLELFNENKHAHVESLIHEISKFPKKLLYALTDLFCLFKNRKNNNIEKNEYKRIKNTLINQSKKYISFDCKCDGRGGHKRVCKYHDNNERNNYLKGKLITLMYAMKHYNNNIKC